MVVYEGVMPDGFTHTVRCQDGTRLNVHDAHLHLKMQADLGNIPRTHPLITLQRGWKRYHQRRSREFSPTKNFNTTPTRVDGLASLPVSPFFLQDLLSCRERFFYQRACLNAKEHFPSALHANLGLLIDVLGAHVARPWGQSVALSTFFLVMVSWLTK